MFIIHAEFIHIELLQYRYYMGWHSIKILEPQFVHWNSKKILWIQVCEKVQLQAVFKNIVTQEMPDSMGEC